jgi:RecB family exonuclease
MSWDPRKWGTRRDPLHQSDIKSLFGAWGCPRRFSYYKTERAEAAERGERYEPPTAHARRDLGTAIHETIARVLRHEPTRRRLHGSDTVPTDASLRRALVEEFDRAVDGRPLYGLKRGQTQLDLLADGVAMVHGALRTLSERMCETTFVEAPFIAPIDMGSGDPIWIEGTIDWIGINDEGCIVLADWKTGARTVPKMDRDRGFQLGLYAYAIAEGELFPGTPNAVQIAEYPDELYIVECSDFVPYKKKGRKAVGTREAADFWGVPVGDKASYEAGDMRGPGWYRSERRLDDHDDMVCALRGIVSAVRAGHIYKTPGEVCERCPFYDACTSEGYEIDGEDAEQLAAAAASLGEDFDDGLEVAV